MKINFHGAAGCVTGSCYLIETQETRFLVDCGMFQGSKSLKENNYKDFPFAAESIDFVLLTHAHIDHTGLLPKLVKHGFEGPVYTSEPTVDLLKHLWPDSAHIQELEVFQKNKRLERKGLPLIEPIYDAEDADKAIGLLKGVRRGEELKPVPSCSVKFRNAGHVLGSSFIEISLTENDTVKKLVFSGDLGEKDHPIVEDPETFAETDFLIVESTYGNRNRKETTKKDRLEKLAKVFKETAERGGNLIIPSFALERTQDLMHDILVLKDKKLIPDMKVVIDSPLAINLTKVFAKYPGCYDDDAQQLVENQGSLFDHPSFQFTPSAQESMELNGQKGIVILSASGMCDAGRIKHHLKHNLWKPENTVLFVGYQAEGTLGRLLLSGKKSVRIHGEEIAVEAKIENISGYSGHADQSGLVDWLDSIERVNNCVFVVHGEEEASAEFAKIIEEKGHKAIAPFIGDSFDLIAGFEAVEAKPKPMAAKEVAIEIDSHNMYAELMLKLAEYMRKTPDEVTRKTLLEKLLKELN